VLQGGIAIFAIPPYQSLDQCRDELEASCVWSAGCCRVVVRRSSFVVRRSSFVVRRSSFVVRRSSFVVRRSSFVVCCLCRCRDEVGRVLDEVCRLVVCQTCATCPRGDVQQFELNNRLPVWLWTRPLPTFFCRCESEYGVRNLACCIFSQIVLKSNLRMFVA